MDERVLTKEQALAELRERRKELEKEHAMPVKRVDVAKEITDIDELFGFYESCKHRGIDMPWNNFKKMWYEFNSYVQNEFYNYIDEFREMDYRDMEMLRLKLNEGLTSGMRDDEITIEKVIEFKNDDVPNYLKQLRRARRVSEENPSPRFCYQNFA